MKDRWDFGGAILAGLWGAGLVVVGAVFMVGAGAVDDPRLWLGLSAVGAGNWLLAVGIGRRVFVGARGRFADGWEHALVWTLGLGVVGCIATGVAGGIL